MNNIEPFLFAQRQLTSDELVYWLLLNRCPGIGPVRFAALLQQEKCLSNYFDGSEPRKDFIDWCQHHGVRSFKADWKGVEQDLAWASQKKCGILTWFDTQYPSSLKEISSPPPVLFVQGNPHCLQFSLQIALVGSRHPTLEGKENAYHFAHELAVQGFAVTSGLALGIDAASHQGALAANGVTIAVLGNGLNEIYPAKHQALARAIIEQGALISEFSINTPPKPAHFPQRNRIISGLSLGVLIIESTLKSGSLITAKYALDQGREVFALPGSIHNPLAKGCHQLIRQGAKCVESVAHIVEEFTHLAQQNARPKTPYPQDLLVETPSKPLQEEESSLAEKTLLPHIGKECTPVDIIVMKTGLTVEFLSSMLLTLELHGLISTVPGGYVRCYR